MATESSPGQCWRCGEDVAVNEYRLCERCSGGTIAADYEETRPERERGWLELDRFLASHAAFERWCAAHPEQADAVIDALAELKELRERGADAA